METSNNANHKSEAVPSREPASVIKVSAQSRSTAVAGAIAGIIRERGRVDVQAIGAGAVNQAMKAAAIARGYLQLDGIDVVVIPSFLDVIIDGTERTAIRLSIEPR
jgi:stage V sporulation protein S